MTWTERNDNTPGYIYLIEAKNVTGMIPGKLIRKCKIGLSRNPDARLQALLTNQPPCDYEILKTVYVEDMASVESMLHMRFSHCNIKLEKSREWFSLNPWQFTMVQIAFNRYERDRKQFSKSQIVGLLLAMAGIGILLGTALQPDSAVPAKQQTALPARTK
jgi:T5orf172 domain